MATPMVMRIMRSTEAFPSQRKNVTSTRPPMAMVRATATAIAAGSGRRPLSDTASIPPSITNSPWAKLMTPVVL